MRVGIIQSTKPASQTAKKVYLPPFFTNLCSIEYTENPCPLTKKHFKTSIPGKHVLRYGYPKHKRECFSTKK